MIDTTQTELLRLEEQINQLIDHIIVYRDRAPSGSEDKRRLRNSINLLQKALGHVQAAVNITES